ncbi:hypothetical protein PBI_CHE8_28 [Mycobacterium phage Che8]|uniref:Uncharacterized protein n=1 Tax=Mycobacterium virus Che8 TaxID=205868 RepID=Q855I2_9CAUD|nr:hypothetical protein PBI_CHE8_28 [Mycobacterium phage Che8]AAN12426.1 hypothetical protein PBI_CHE8_28 [Mycobacterium phage Che8]
MIPGASSRQELILAELERANATIRRHDAVVTIEDDGDVFSYVDPEKLPADFLEYYSSLSAAVYALGAIR